MAQLPEHLFFKHALRDVSRLCIYREYVFVCSGLPLVGAAFLGVVGAVQPFLKVVFVLVGLLELAVGAYNIYAGFKMSPQAGLIT